FPSLGYLTYEKLRILWWSADAAALILLFSYPAYLALAVITTLPLIGMLVWNFWAPEIATTFVVPGAFLISAIAHALLYKRNRGYASCVLTACSLMLAMMCSLYFLVVSGGDPRVI